GNNHMRRPARLPPMEPQLQVQVTEVLRQLCGGECDRWGSQGGQGISPEKFPPMYKALYGQLEFKKHGYSRISEIFQVIPYIQLCTDPPMLYFSQYLEDVACPCGSSDGYLECMWCCHWREPLDEEHCSRDPSQPHSGLL
ncbi:hypothetical protein CYMTET_55303, partial [Cymbomonas tetramitiformis]